jgi:hypothetical protein
MSPGPLLRLVEAVAVRHQSCVCGAARHFVAELAMGGEINAVEATRWLLYSRELFLRVGHQRLMQLYRLYRLCAVPLLESVG